MIFWVGYRNAVQIIQATHCFYCRRSGSRDAISSLEDVSSSKLYSRYARYLRTMRDKILFRTFYNHEDAAFPKPHFQRINIYCVLFDTPRTRSINFISRRYTGEFISRAHFPMSEQNRMPIPWEITLIIQRRDRVWDNRTFINSYNDSNVNIHEKQTGLRKCSVIVKICEKYGK